MLPIKFIFSTKLLFFFNLHSLLGSYTCIEIRLALQRNIILYLQQLYLPSTLIVALSFIAFWIDYKSHPARTLLSLLSIVTITTKAEGTKKIKSNTPQSSFCVCVCVCFSSFTLHMRAHYLLAPFFFSSISLHLNHD